MATVSNIASGGKFFASEGFYGIFILADQGATMIA